MKVQLRNDWFAPEVSVKVGVGDINLRAGGKFYEGKNGPEGGVHEMPEALREYLPASAVVLDEEIKPEKVVAKKQPSLKEFDHARNDGTAEVVEAAKK